MNIKITLPDGSVKEYPGGITPYEVAKDISEGLARNVISAKFNGKTVETSTPLTTDGDLVLFTWNDDEGKKAFWHSSAHLMAQAIQKFYPDAKLTIGPAIDNGFYYDIDFGDAQFSEKDFEKIEKKMLEIARGKHEFKLHKVSKDEALKMYQDENNPFKVELIENLTDGEISFCDHDDFTDLCRGGHIPHTGLIKAVKLLNVAGAYWRGDEKNPQLTRVYGISFPVPQTKNAERIFGIARRSQETRSSKVGQGIGTLCFFQQSGTRTSVVVAQRSGATRTLGKFLKKSTEKSRIPTSGYPAYRA